MRRRIAMIAGVLVVAVVAAGLTLRVVGVWGGTDRTAFEQAVRLVPADSQRYTWTDWAGIRSKLGVELDSDSSNDALRRFLDAGFTADLTSTSGLVESAPLLQQKFGFSPASLDWELLAQSTQGAVEVMKVPDSTDMDQLQDTAAALGYPRPDDADGVWAGGAQVLGTVAMGTDADGTATPTLQNLAFLADRHLVLASDSDSYLREVVDGFDDHAAPVDAVVAHLVEVGGGDPLSAVAFTGDYTCRYLAMATADGQTQRQADQLIEQAGGVSPLSGYAVGDDADGRTRVVLGFSDADRARSDADSRARLASGPAAGKGGDYADLFDLGKVVADGDLVTMELTPKPDAYVLSELSAGPVLLATC